MPKNNASVNDVKKGKNTPMSRKKEIIVYYNNNPGISQRSLARVFYASLGSINKIIKNKEQYNSNDATLVNELKIRTRP